MKCLACGADNLPTNRFCGQCGLRLDGGAPTSNSPSVHAMSSADDEAERRQLTVMFCDLVGSTALSSRLDPEDLREVMQAYRDAAVGAITRYDGRVAKYLGDGILAYFGYPIAHDDDAARAVAAGLAIVEAMPALEARAGRPRGVEIKCRVGIATGPVVVGEMGAGDQRESMAVIGEAPNLADRLQELAPRNSVVVSPLTRQLIEPRFNAVSLGRHELRGIGKPVEVFRITGSSNQHLAAVPRLPLTGRDSELAQLRAAFDHARAGRGQAVALGGEPGIGKSRLIKALKNEALSQRALWLEAQCSSYHTDAPLYPAIELMSRALCFRRNETAAERLHRLETFAARLDLPSDPHLPLLATMLSIPDEGRYRLPALSPQALRARTLHSIVEVLSRLAARRPMVLAVEDLHWADESTLDFVDVLMASLADLPLLAVFTHRPDFDHEWPDRAPLARLSLGRLSPDEGARLVNHVAGDMALPAGVVSAILSRSDGVPLFVEEITRTVVDLCRRTDAFCSSGDAPLDAVEIPATLKDSLMARLDRLGDAKDVAQAAAAIGRNFVYELLADVAGLDEASLRQALRALEVSGLVQRRGEPPSAIYTFRHALIREIAYDSMLRRRRQMLHAAIARALETNFREIVETQPDLLGRHFAQAGDEDRAIDYFERAGQRAVARSAHVEAVRHFRRALDLVEKIEDASPQLGRKARLWSALAPSLLVTRGYGSVEVGEAFQRADELSHRLGDPERRFYSGWGITAFRFVTGDLTGTLEMLDRLETIAEAVGQANLRAITLMSRGVVLFSLGRYADSMSETERGLASYDPEQAQLLIARLGQDVSVLARAFGGVAAWGMGQPDLALDMVHDAVESARRNKQSYSLALALTIGLSLVRFRRGEIDEAMLALDEAIEITRENQFPYFYARATAMRGLIETRVGQIEAGLAHLNEGIKAFRARGGVTTVPMMMVWLADGQLSASNPIAAHTALTEGLRLVEAGGEASHLAEIHRLLGRAMLALGDREEAGRCFRAAYDTADRQGANGWRLRAALDLCEHLKADGQCQSAATLVGEALQAIDGGASTRDVRSAREFIDRVRLSSMSSQ